MKTCRSSARDGKGDHGRKDQARETLGSLLRRYEGMARQFAYRLAGNPEEAKELVQQASYKALKHWERTDPLKSFRTWYLTIVRNLFLDARRRMVSRVTLSLSAPAEDTGYESLADALPDGEPGPLEQLERREQIEVVRRSLAGLSRARKDILVLCDLEGMRYEDAARKLGIPVGTVRSGVARARAALRRNPTLRSVA